MVRRTALAAWLDSCVCACLLGMYGAVGSPGHDPSLVPVGVVNLHGTAARSDDTVTGFNSRGTTLAGGERWIDKLLEPDLVAPGDRIVGTPSSDALGTREASIPHRLQRQAVI